MIDYIGAHEDYLEEEFEVTIDQLLYGVAFLDEYLTNLNE